MLRLERPVPIRPVLVSSTLSGGGSAKAALRLLRGLRQNGVEAQLVTPQPSNGEPGVVGLWSAAERCGVMAVKATEISLRALYPQRKDVPFTSAWFGSRMARRLQALGATVVHFQQCNNGFLSLRMARQCRLPAVWTIHDWWPMTGGCHFPGRCEGHQTGCGRCPALGSSRARDLSWVNYRVKRRAWKHGAGTLVAVSAALQSDLQRSVLLGDRKVGVVPNGLDLSVFRPVAKFMAREILGLPPHAKILLFGAKRSDANKGFQDVPRLMQEAVRSNAAGTVLATFGDNAPLPADFAVPVKSFGLVEDDLKLVLLYSAADLTLVPSRQESFGLVAAESLACGAPVLAYATSGLRDIVDHRENGFLAEVGSLDDYIAGAKWLLARGSETEGARDLAARARAKAEREFDILQIARRYLELYTTEMQSTGR